MAEMIRSQIKAAERAGLRVAPFIGIGCPGIIQPDGTIERGAQNLPGNWESSRFNLIESVRETVPSIGKHETMVTMHSMLQYRRHHLLPRASLPLGSSLRPPFSSVCRGLGCPELGAGPQHGVHDDREAAGECDPRLAHRPSPSDGERQSLSFSAPL